MLHFAFSLQVLKIPAKVDGSHPHSYHRRIIHSRPHQAFLALWFT
jgi:hypothetical protein